MGVPKFYRWLSERYPCLSQTIKEHQIPEFDNLYLDMNGIIHPCSHPNNEDPHFRITEEQIITNVFEYIENLFRIVKPRKNLFMAVDGCAPRAKMNQQRARRFRTAKESSEAMQHALDKGELLPNDDTFDSNCITPGTEFMENLQKHLEYFINEKLSNDPLWKECTVHFSGHDVPGEGEHKIMDYIRYMKSQEDYDPNTRHCLYGLDADLIMLGLSVHEPHFCLLREEVLFEERDRDCMLAPVEQVYHLFHLSLLRDYLHIEFKGIQDKLSFEYDLEKIIDDWIFLGFLVGNDFVPHLPHMHINNDALPYFYSVYKNFLLTADGYLNDGGHLNLHRMKEFFKRISQFDFDIYSEYKKVEKEKSNKIVKKNSGEDGEKEFLIETPEGTEGLSNAFANFSLRKNFHSQLNRKETNDPEIVTGLQAHKEKYYMNKCSIDINKSGELIAICTDYVKALQWICHYYFNGLQSWSWYYPYHYSPYMSDLAQLDISQVHFEMGEALKPFEQLLAVLPSASKQLLPKPFQHLMSNETSEIIEYFPADFETDLNGKKQQYEAVVLIPFIQEDRLLRAMKEHYHQLTPEERKRNTFGDACQFSRDATRTDQHFPPTHPAFLDIKNCPVRKQVVQADQYQLPRITKGVLEGARFDMTGTPTLTNLDHTCDFAREGVQVFKRKSRSESAIIKLNPTSQQEMEETARQLLGGRVYVEWPFNVEALVTGLTNEYFHYHLDRNKQLNMKVLAAEEYSSFKKETAVLSAYHTFERGVHLGKVEVLVKARPLLGKRHVYGENNQALLVNEWADHNLLYPLQTVVKKQGEEKYVCERASDLFAPGSRCVLLSRPHYGHTGEVIGYNDKDDKVNVAINITKEPNLNQIAFDRLSTTEYVSFEAITSQMQLNHDVLARITGDVFIRKQNQDGSMSTYNIGLGIKYTKRNMEMLGYAKRATFGWVFSEQAVRVLDDYMKRYPEIFIALNAKPSPDAVENYFNFHELLPDKNEDYLHEVRTFLKQQTCFNGKLIRCQSNVLEAPIVEKIEHVVHQNKGAWDKMLKVKVRPDLLLCPSSHNHIGNKDIYVFDRVVNINHTMRVPFGARGTVIGIHNVFIDKNSVRAKSEHNYEVLFDDLINTLRSLKSAMVKANSIILLNPEKSKIERRFRHQQSLNSQWKKLRVMTLKDTIQRSFCTSARRSFHTSSAVQRPVLCRPSLFTFRTVSNKLVNVRSVKYIASVACFCLLLAR